MKPKKRSNSGKEKYKERVPALIVALKGLTLGNALAALLEAARHLLNETDSSDYYNSTPLSLGNLTRRTKGGRLPKIESDPELQSFLHGIIGYHSLSELVRLCQEKFGMERAPSKSCLHRYTQKLTRQSAEQLKREYA